MATTGLEVFDRTLHTTNVWLDEISADLDSDRHQAWHVLGAVLRSIRDEILVEQSAHFAAQLPLLVRGAYFDQYRPAVQPLSARSQDEFIARIQLDLDGARPVSASHAATVVMRTLNRHVTEGQVKKVRDALPKGVRALWPEPQHADQQKSGQSAKSQGSRSDQGSQGAEPARSAGQPSPPSGGPQRSEQQRAASQPSAPQPSAPRPSAPHHPEPRHAEPQRAAAQHAHGEPDDLHAYEIEEIDGYEIDAEEEDTSPLSRSSSRSSSGKGAQAPVGASGRPARVQAAPATSRTASAGRTKTRTKRPDDQD